MDGTCTMGVTWPFQAPYLVSYSKLQSIIIWYINFLDSVKSRYSRSLLTRNSPIQILTLSNKILLLNRTKRTYLKWVNNIIWVIAEVISTTRLPKCKTNGTLPLDVQRKSLEQSLYKPRKHCNGGHPNMSDQILIHTKGLILIITYQVSNQIMTPRLSVRQT